MNKSYSEDGKSSSLTFPPLRIYGRQGIDVNLVFFYPSNPVFKDTAAEFGQKREAAAGFLVKAIGNYFFIARVGRPMENVYVLDKSQ